MPPASTLPLDSCSLGFARSAPLSCDSSLLAGANAGVISFVLLRCARLLAPGEQAFNQQQGIEEEVAQNFGKGRGTNRPKK